MMRRNDCTYRTARRARCPGPGKRSCAIRSVREFSCAVGVLIPAGPLSARAAHGYLSPGRLTMSIRPPRGVPNGCY